MTKFCSNEINLDTCLVVASDQITSQLGDESVILGLSDGMYYGLDAIGTRIWGLLDCPQSARRICEALREDYEVQAVECEDAVLALLRDLKTRALIEIRP